jgi:hypothetical protein
MRARWKPSEFKHLERPFSRAGRGEIRRAVAMFMEATNTIAD